MGGPRTARPVTSSGAADRGSGLTSASQSRQAYSAAISFAGSFAFMNVSNPSLSSGFDT